MSGLIPNKFFKGKNADGSKFTAEEWDYADIATLDAMTFVVYLFVGCLFSAIAPVLITAIAILTYSGRSKMLYIIGILSSGYFLWDANHGWFVIMIVNWVMSEAAINTLMGLTAACLVLNAIFLVFGGVLYNIINSLSNSTRTCWLVFLTFVAIVALVTFSSVKGTYSHRKGWVETNVNDGLEFSKTTQ